MRSHALWLHSPENPQAMTVVVAAVVPFVEQRNRLAAIVQVSIMMQCSDSGGAYMISTETENGGAHMHSRRRSISHALTAAGRTCIHVTVAYHDAMQ
eukprot:COSAG05_NODE_2_length_63105_cov_159.292956_4_plen_97_part_00